MGALIPALIRSRGPRSAKLPRFVAYGGAGAAALAAILLRGLLDPWLGADAQYSLVLGAVALSVWLGGVGPALFAALLGYSITNFLFIEPRGQLAITQVKDVINLLLFAFACTLIIALGSGMRRARDRARAAEADARQIANNIDQFAWTCDELGRSTWYNDRWYEYTGSTPKEMRGDGWKKLHDPAHLDRVVARIRQCLQTGQPWEDTFPLRGKDGQYRWFLSRAIPIRDADGRVIRWFGTNTDVTELRNLQRALEDTDRRKDEFLATLAHELRNPIAPIRTAGDILSRLVVDDEKQQSLVAIIQRQAVHLARLLDDLLDVARITQNRVNLQREVVALPSCIAMAVETAQPLIREKDHRLTVTQTLTPLYVNGDKVRLAQCLANLLINAAKFTAPDGEIRVSMHTQGDDVVVDVSDNGMGIAAEFMPRVFDLFTQGDRSLAGSNSGGLGIGLSICRKLIEMHGGSVAVRSAGLGHGATFTIRLPRADAPAQSATSTTASLDSARRVLIVDDNQDAADSLAMLLQMEGHVTTTVYCGEEALQKMIAFNPEVVLLDIGLPELNGYEVAQRMREVAPSVRLIAVSGYGQPEDKQRSSEAGFSAHLVKPVAVLDIRKVLAAATTA